MQEPMPQDSRFGPRAQTPEQRATILKKMEAICPGIKTKASTHTVQLYEQYVKGELSWGEVRALRGLHEKSTTMPKRPGSHGYT